MKEIIENYQIFKSLTNKTNKNKNKFYDIAEKIIEIGVFIFAMIFLGSCLIFIFSICEWININILSNNGILKENVLLYSSISTLVLFLILKISSDKVNKVSKERVFLDYISNKKRETLKITNKEYVKIKKELTEEELLFLKNLKNIDYKKSLSENILDYISKNNLNEKEKENIKEIIKDFKLDKEKVDFLLFKQNKKEIKKTNIISI